DTSYQLIYALDSIGRAQTSQIAPIVDILLGMVNSQPDYTRDLVNRTLVAIVQQRSASLRADQVDKIRKLSYDSGLPIFDTYTYLPLPAIATDLATPAGDAAPETVLAVLMHDADARVRAIAAYQAGTGGEIGEAQAAQRLTELQPLLQDQNAAPRYYALVSTVRLGLAHAALAPDVATTLRQLFQNRDPEMRAFQAAALQQMLDKYPRLSTPELIDFLVPLLQERDAAVKGYAARMVGQAVEHNPRLATSKLIAPLRELRQNGDVTAQSVAAFSLVQLEVANPTLSAAVVAVLREAPAPPSQPAMPDPAKTPAWVLSPKDIFTTLLVF